MKGFIEVTCIQTRSTHFININHIVEVIDNTIYTDDAPGFVTDFPHIDCVECYEEIVAKIGAASI